MERCVGTLACRVVGPVEGAPRCCHATERGHAPQVHGVVGVVLVEEEEHEAEHGRQLSSNAYERRSPSQEFARSVHACAVDTPSEEAGRQAGIITPPKPHLEQDHERVEELLEQLYPPGRDGRRRQGVGAVLRESPVVCGRQTTHITPHRFDEWVSPMCAENGTYTHTQPHTHTLRTHPHPHPHQHAHTHTRVTHFLASSAVSPSLLPRFATLSLMLKRACSSSKLSMCST